MNRSIDHLDAMSVVMISYPGCVYVVQIQPRKYMLAHSDRPVLAHLDRPVLLQSDRHVLGHSDRPALTWQYDL